jgi:hypothetical protein
VDEILPAGKPISAVVILPLPGEVRLAAADESQVALAAILVRVLSVWPENTFKSFQCPPVTVNPARRKSSAKSFSIVTAASNGIGFKWLNNSGNRRTP